MSTAKPQLFWGLLRTSRCCLGSLVAVFLIIAKYLVSITWKLHKGDSCKFDCSINYSFKAGKALVHWEAGLRIRTLRVQAKLWGVYMYVCAVVCICECVCDKLVQQFWYLYIDKQEKAELFVCIQYRFAWTQEHTVALTVLLTVWLSLQSSLRWL